MIIVSAAINPTPAITSKAIFANDIPCIRSSNPFLLRLADTALCIP